MKYIRNVKKGEKTMLYNYIKEHYKEAEPIFFSDLEREDITKSALNQQLKKLCNKGLLQKYEIHSELQKH